MSTMSLPILNDVKRAILEKLGQGSLRPTELLRELDEFDDLDIRQALSQLNQDGLIQLRPDRRLAVVQNAA